MLSCFRQTGLNIGYAHHYSLSPGRVLGEAP